MWGTRTWGNRIATDLYLGCTGDAAEATKSRETRLIGRIASLVFRKEKSGLAIVGALLT